MVLHFSETASAGHWRNLEVAVKVVLFKGGHGVGLSDRATWEVAVASSMVHRNVVRARLKLGGEAPCASAGGTAKRSMLLAPCTSAVE